MFHEPPDVAALAGRVTAFKDHCDAFFVVLDPPLQFDKFDLEELLFLFVVDAFENRSNVDLLLLKFLKKLIMILYLDKLLSGQPIGLNYFNESLCYAGIRVIRDNQFRVRRRDVRYSQTHAPKNEQDSYDYYKYRNCFLNSLSGPCF